MIRLLWLIPLFPFAGFALNGLLGARVLPRKWIGWIACAAVLLSFIVALGAVSSLGHLPESTGAAAGSSAEASAAESGDGRVTPGLAIDHETRRVTQTLYDWMPLGPGRDGRAVSIAWS